MGLTRRAFLQCIVVTAAIADGCSSDDDAPSVEVGAAYFPQSVASGDPRPDSVVLWTRIVDGALSAGDRSLVVEVATDAGFTHVVARESALVALLDNDNAIKVKVVGLTARTVYFYRFIYQAGSRFSSPTGRTRTAPAATDDTPVRFAIGNCQDFVGRYYNSWQHLTELDLDLDFILFLGDYIYETTGNPAFMQTGGQRPVVLADPGAAIRFGSADAPFFAAKSLSNYRDLYKTYRSDPFLQRAHERYPFIFMWDDHEYSDDCWGATATYTNGVTDETDVPRRQNSERAFFEYIPLDHPGTGSGEVDIAALPVYPDTHIYRDLAFGKNMRLLVADYRTYRPDHLIPEDAYPAAVVMNESDLAGRALTSAFAADTFAYVDIDDPAYALQRAILVVAYQQLAIAAGLDEAAASARAVQAVHGNLALAYVNGVLANPALTFPPIDAQDKPRGLAWVHMGKRDLFASQGSRYIVIKDTLDAYAAFRWDASAGESEDVFGAAQQAWLDGALASPEVWKVLVSSVSMTSVVVDLRDKTDIPDPALRNRYYLNVDMWDGFPVRRQRLLGQLAAVPAGKMLVVSGDFHAAFASVESGVTCLTSPAISSETIKNGARSVAAAAGFDETTAVYRYLVTDIDTTLAAGNSGLAFSETDSNGFLVVELGAAGGTATFYLLQSSETQTDYSSRPAELAAKVVTRTFRIAAGAITS